MSAARNAAKRRKLAHKRALGRVAELEQKTKEQQSLIGDLALRAESTGVAPDEVRQLRSEVQAARAVVRDRDRSISELSSSISDLEIELETLKTLKDAPAEDGEVPDPVASLLKSTLLAFEDRDAGHEVPDLSALKSCLQECSDAAPGITACALDAIACAEAASDLSISALEDKVSSLERKLAIAQAAPEEKAVTPAEPSSAGGTEELEKRVREAERLRDEALAEAADLKRRLDYAAADEGKADAAELDELRLRLREAEDARDEAVREAERLRDEAAETKADESLAPGQEELQQALADAQREATEAATRAKGLEEKLEEEKERYKTLMKSSFPLPSQEGVVFGAEVCGEAPKKSFLGKKKPFVIEAFCYHRDGRISVMDAEGAQLPINQEKWNG